MALNCCPHLYADHIISCSAHSFVYVIQTSLISTEISWPDITYSQVVHVPGVRFTRSREMGEFRLWATPFLHMLRQIISCLYFDNGNWPAPADSPWIASLSYRVSNANSRSMCSLASLWKSALLVVFIGEVGQSRLYDKIQSSMWFHLVLDFHRRPRWAFWEWLARSRNARDTHPHRASRRIHWLTTNFTVCFAKYRVEFRFRLNYG